jgi:hypothetical protein
MEFAISFGGIGVVEPSSRGKIRTPLVTPLNIFAFYFFTSILP